ncbi:hypothetical protein EAF04_005856 [Stromatinia cepivora]|nr:hypothetical protein EAF04_005856 [Stromatinia cepivora]
MLHLLACMTYHSEDNYTSTAIISFISALLEMGVDIHHKHGILGSPLSWLIQANLNSSRLPYFPVIMEAMPLQIMTWFELLRKADYDLQAYIFQEWKYYQRCIIDPHGQRGVWYMHIFHARSIANIICKFEWYDYRHQYRNIILSETRQNRRLPGAWEDDADEKELIECPWNFEFLYDEASVCKLRRPRRTPDLEMSFEIGPLIDGDQKFSHIGSILRRELNCDCSWWTGCPHEPPFGRCNADTDEMDLCEYLEGESDDESEDGSEDDGNNAGEGQKEEDVQERHSESKCGSEYYCCKHCGRSYWGLAVVV